MWVIVPVTDRSRSPSTSDTPTGAPGSKKVAMVTEPLDIAGLMAELNNTSSSYDGVHPDLRVGHIHLQVSNLDNAKKFYHHLLDLDITQENYPGALFLSADGYHHHIGLNIWNSRGSQPAAENARGLMSFEVATSSDRLGLIADRIKGQQSDLVRMDANKHRIVDPDGMFLDLSGLNNKMSHQ